MRATQKPETHYSKFEIDLKAEELNIYICMFKTQSNSHVMVNPLSISQYIVIV